MSMFSRRTSTTSVPASPSATASTPAVASQNGALPAQRREGKRQAHGPRRGAMLGPSFRSALEALQANRTRSLLTTLGVIVGVAAVIAAVTLTESTSTLINSRLTGLGTNTLTIIPAAAQSGGAFGAAGTSQSLTTEDVTAIASVAHVSNASPVLTSGAQVVYGSQNTNTRVMGVYPSFQQIGNWQMGEGAWFGSTEESGGTAVAVLGATTADTLFSTTGTDPVGQTVLIKSQAFRVVGVLKAKGASFGANQDDLVYVPFSAAQARLKNAQFVDQIQAQVDSAGNVDQAQADITTLLEERHRLPTSGPDDFSVRSSNQLVQTAQQFTQTLTLLLVGIAAISLLVGGIGIMNIMLVSVTERTREIGTRMAIGARRGDIRNQFLIESLTLSGLGGVLGILIGLLGGLVMTRAFGLGFSFNPIPILLAFGVSAVIGVIFGLYPAIRASQLDPIVALRTE
ncbi:MAG: ABC transporter permease [Ktedonobacterales bacterium]